MKTRFLQGLVIVALVVPFSSCPLAPQVSLGVWIVDIVYSNGPQLVGVELLANGTLQTPNPLPPEATANRGFQDPVSWSQDGSTVSLLEDQILFGDIVYTGTVKSSRRIIDGIWTLVDTGETGTWTAMKL